MDSFLMAAYFPYSQIIGNIYTGIKETVTHHAYFGEWAVADSGMQLNVSTSSGYNETYY